MKFKLLEGSLTLPTNKLFYNLEKDFGTSDTPISGPSYILPDGKFLNVPPVKGVDGLLAHRCHSEINLYLISEKMVKGYKVWDIDNMYVMEEAGAIRVNMGEPQSKDPMAKLIYRMDYCVLPAKLPTTSQMYALEDWLNDMYGSGRAKQVEVGILHERFKTYRFDDITPEEIIQRIRKYYATGRLEESISLTERATVPLTDQRIKSLIDECVALCKRAGFDYPYEDIQYDMSDNLSTLGDYTMTPNYGAIEHAIRLNKHILSDTDEVVKSTILHELAHFIDYMWHLENDYIQISPSGNQLVRNRAKRYPARILGHQQHWKNVATKLSQLSGLDIQRTGESAALDQHIQDSAKYVVRCKNCGAETRFSRKTDFVKDPNAKSQYGDWYKWQCGKCHKSGNFEVIELR